MIHYATQRDHYASFFVPKFIFESFPNSLPQRQDAHTMKLMMKAVALSQSIIGNPGRCMMDMMQSNIARKPHE